MTGLQVYNDAGTGIPLAVMDCSYLTGLENGGRQCDRRSPKCARTAHRTMALVGCGFEGACICGFSSTKFPRSKKSGFAIFALPP